MRIPLTARLGLFAAAALSAAGLGGATATVASAWHAPAPPALFVSASTLSGYGHSSCRSADYTTISAAVSAAAPGARIIVCPGTYTEGVTVSKQLTISGIHATVDATGQDNGFTLPTPAAGTSIEGFTIENAIGEGIRAVSTNDVSILENTIVDNDKGITEPNTYPECTVTEQNPVPDCGEGVHLLGTANSHLIGNRIGNNAGGVLMTDETGPTDGNVLEHNRVFDNTDDCGITLAGHNPAAAPGGTPNPAAGGVYDNLIKDNVSVDNGVAGQGGGVLLASGIPIGGGAVYDNTVTGNFLEGNGLAGVTVHNHFPNQDLNGNRIVHNVIGTNNLDGDPDFGPVVDPSTTGVFVGTAGAPMTITIEHNVIYSNEIGIFLTGPLNTEKIRHNRFFNVTTNIVGP
jgi:parallel beta-helix repeat protein